MMTLPGSVTRHHTAWIHCADCPSHPVRYAIDGDRMLCFGDALPYGAANGRQLFVAVHEIAGGQALAEIIWRYASRGHDLDRNAVIELLEHISLGRTAEEVEPRSPATATPPSSRSPTDEVR